MTRDRGHEPNRPATNMNPYKGSRDRQAIDSYAWSPYPEPPPGTHVPDAATWPDSIAARVREVVRHLPKDLDPSIVFDEYERGHGGCHG